MVASPEELSAAIRQIYRANQLDVVQEQLRIVDNLPYYLGSRFRFRSVQGRMISAIENSISSARTFYGRDFADIYKAGAEFGTGVPHVLTAADGRIIATQRKAGLQELEHAAAYAKGDVRRVAPLSNNPTVTTVGGMRNNGVRAMTYSDGRRFKLDTHADMSISARSSTLFNRASVEASHRQGVELWEIQDGPECGLTSHHDPQKANGMVVDKKTALKNLIAHPYCRRRFVPHKGESRAKKLIDAARAAALKQAKYQATFAAGNAVLLSAAAVRETEMYQRILEHGLRAEFGYNSMVARAQYLKIQLERHLFAGENVIDINTGLPVNRKLSLADVLDHLDSWQRNYAQGRNVPEYVRRVLQVQARPLRQVIGDDFTRFGSWVDRSTRAVMSVDDLQSLVELERNAQQAFFDWIGERRIGNRFFRFTMPDLSGAGRRPRIRLLPDSEKVKATLTYTRERGLLPNLRVNPNGLIRAGFEVDPESKMLFPSLSIVPKGPIRIITKLNRAGGFLVTEDTMGRALEYAIKNGIPREVVKLGERIGTGRVTSLSVKVRIVTKLGQIGNVSLVNPEFNFTVNLRKLGLDKLRDILNLSVDKFRSLGLEDVKFISYATDLRIKGWGPFDWVKRLTEYSKNIGFKWPNLEEDAKKIDALAEIGFKARLQREMETAKTLLDKAGNRIKVEAQSIVQGIHNLSDGKTTITLEGVRNQLMQDLQMFAPKSVLQSVAAELDMMSERIYTVMNSEHRFLEAVAQIRDAQVRMIEIVTKRPVKALEEEAVRIWHKLPTLIKPVADIHYLPIDFVPGSIIDEYDDVIGEILHDAENFGDTKFRRDLYKVFNMLSDRYPMIGKIHAAGKDLGTHFDEEGKLLGTWAQMFPNPVDQATGAIMEIDDNVRLGWDTFMDKMAQLSHSLGWGAGSPRPISTLVHESGHHLTNMLLPSEESRLYSIAFDQIDQHGMFRKLTDEFKQWLDETGWDLATLRDDAKAGLVPESVLDSILELQVRKQPLDRIVNMLGAYGAKNAREFVAEAFNEYITTETPRATAKAIGQFFDKTLGSGSTVKIETRMRMWLARSGLDYQSSVDKIRGFPGTLWDYIHGLKKPEVYQEIFTQLDDYGNPYRVFRVGDSVILDNNPEFYLEEDPEQMNVIQDFLRAYNRMFPRLPPVSIQVTELAHDGGEYINGKILINTAEMSDRWVDFLRRIPNGYFSVHETGLNETLVHEMAHHMIDPAIFGSPYEFTLVQWRIFDEMEVSFREEILREMRRIAEVNRDPIPILDDVMAGSINFSKAAKKALFNLLGAYSGDNIQEALCEAMTRYMLSPRPNRISTIVGEAMTQIYGRPW